jgi:flagellar motor switch protein FliN/FliY
MTADALSQEEIDALLKGGSSGEVAEQPKAGPPPVTQRQIQGAAKYGELAASTLSDMVGTFLAAPASFSVEKPAPRTTQQLAASVSGPVVLLIFSYESGLRGGSTFIFRQEDACKIGGTMVGDPAASEFSDMVADAFKEVMSTVLGNLSTTLAKAAGGPVSNSQLDVEATVSAAEPLSAALAGDEGLVLLSYDMKVGDLLQGQCWQMISMPLAETMEVLAAPNRAAAPEKKSAPPQMKAAPVEFDSLTEETPALAPSNLDLIMDIGLDIRVELGRSHLKIRDILKLGSGSVVELDKLAGEPVDLLVNDVTFAKGEVVVIDENFGVRVTDILSLQDRIKTLGERKD